VLGLLAHAYAFSDNKIEAGKYWTNLMQLSKQRYVTAYSFAIVYLGLATKSRRFAGSKKYQDRAGYNIVSIKVDPFLDPLRGDPRFENLVAKVFAPKNGPSP